MSQQETSTMDSTLVEANAAAAAPEPKSESSRDSTGQHASVGGTSYRTIVQLVCFIFPWPGRRWLLCRLLGFSIHPTARIGFSLIYADEVTVDKQARLGHLNYIGRLDRFVMGE